MMALLSDTAEALISGYPWDAKRLSITGAGTYESGSHK